MIISFLLVGLGGGLGALTRLIFSALSKKYLGKKFPWGTLIINITGSFVLGLVSRYVETEYIRLLVGIGFLGGYTTFSTFNYEAMKLLQYKKYNRFIIYVIGTYAICMCMVVLGYLI